MGMELIEQIEVGSGGIASVTFSAIPQDGIDLICTVSARSTNASVINGLSFTYNGIGTTTYTVVGLRGDGSTASTYSSYAINRWFFNTSGATSTANTFGSGELRISNYTASQAKSASLDGVSENSATEARAAIWALSESGTSPVTSLTVSSSNLAEHSIVSLYKTIVD
tara:strand:+ start:703 stop:1206 length:504 start_codon:yes stop_codon:yes gene_type:complete